MKKLLLSGIAALSVLSASAAHTREWQGNMPKPIGKLPSYPPTVCVTPNWKPEPCKSRQSSPKQTLLTTETAHVDPTKPEYARWEWSCDTKVTVGLDEGVPPQILKEDRDHTYKWKYGDLYLDDRRCTLRSKSVYGNKRKTKLYNELGGYLPEHIRRWQALAASGDDVEIRGVCPSACTLIMAYIPREKICFDGFASLKFHAAAGRLGKPDLQTTEWMVDQYPEDIRAWLKNKGAPEKMTFEEYWGLPAVDLWKMGYRECEPEEPTWRFKPAWFK